MSKTLDLKHYALSYAQKGIPVFPCRLDKRPYTKHGFKEATTDVDIISAWWQEHPDASIGVPTGELSNMWALDIDEPGGSKTLSQLEKKNGPLPETLCQKTGGGGTHYFFRLPNSGRTINNSANKVGKKIDVRSSGGYVILAPSPHPSGNNYQWLKKHEITQAPEWLIELAMSKDEPESAAPTNYGPTPYGQAALANEIIKLSSVGKGQRNDTLNQCAFSLSQLVAGGELEEGTVKNSLLATAIAVGLKQVEARKTIESGFKAGLAKPRASEGNQSNQSNRSNQSNQTTPEYQKVTESNPKVTEVTGQRGRFQGNLTGAIREFVQEYQGSFTTSDIDREFGLYDPADKNVRKRALNKLVLEKYIKKDIRLVGKYHILKSDVSFIDFDATDASPFQIELPLDLNHMVRIPKKSIIVMAGSTNSGKTALAIDFLRRNLHQKYQLMYLMSEMGPSEYKQRIQNSIDDLALWKEKVLASDVPGGFDTVIANHNPDGLTVIDFLEEIQGEYYRIASDLRAIYDGLGEGVAIVCLQKHSKADVGRGGEATAEKPRLYLSIDKLVHERQSTISAIKIYKAKEYISDNPNGLERHIVFTKRGSEIKPISEWMYCNTVQRQKWIEHYEQRMLRGESACDEEDKAGFCFYFTTKSGASVRIAQRDIEKWRDSFPNINVDAELIRISESSKQKGFLNDRSYFFQISGILTKKNNESTQR